MKIKISNEGKIKVIPVFKDDADFFESSEFVKKIIDKKLFEGKAKEIYASLHDDEPIIVLGLGNKEEISTKKIIASFNELANFIIKAKADDVLISFDKKMDKLCYKKSIKAMVEGLMLGEYKYDKYKSSKKEDSFKIDRISIKVWEDKKDKAQKAIDEAIILQEGVNFAKDLVNERAIDLYPQTLAEKAKEVLAPLGVDVEIYGKKEIEDLNMKAFLAVSQGSDKEPKLIVMKYMKGGDKKLTALVGKGLTYDSGGYCIKRPDGMATMHCDMGGSASVIGAMKAIAANKLEVNVVAIVAACENMISGSAYKTGDIVSSMAGKTIEVGNTDAEGRLTLADAVYYANKVVKADKIVDVATLTGACVVALGSYRSGFVTNNEEFKNELLKASELSDEGMWEMPHDEEYKEMLKGTFGDLKNSIPGGAGMITAGLFVGEFIDDIPWIHIDIAGTAYNTKDLSYYKAGATGIPVKTLYYLLKEEKSCH